MYESTSRAASNGRLMTLAKPNRSGARVAFSFSRPEVESYCSVRLPHLRGTGVERRGPCPLHKGERDSFAMNIENGLWTCHACAP